MKTARETIESNSVPADASRSLTAALPLRVIGGRGIVDAQGRIILNAHARRTMSDDGNIAERSESEGALSPVQADANVHAIAHALNNAQRIGQALRDLVNTIEECAAFNDPAGAYDRIREHAEGARDLADDLGCGAGDGNVATPTASPVADALRVYLGGRVVARSKNLAVIGNYTRRGCSVIDVVEVAGASMFIKWHDGATLRTVFADPDILLGYVARSRTLQRAQRVRINGAERDA